MFTVTRSRCGKVNYIDLNNNVSDNDSNIDESKEEELQFSLNIGSDWKANEEDDSNTSWKWRLMNQILRQQSC